MERASSKIQGKEGIDTIRTNWTETWDSRGWILVAAQLPYVLLNYSLCDDTTMDLGYIRYVNSNING